MTILLLAACGSDSAEVNTEDLDEEILGTWELTYFNAEYTFNEDLTGEDSFWDLPFTYTTEGGVLTITYTGTSYDDVRYYYEISGDTLTLTDMDDETYSETYTKVTESQETEEESSDDSTDNTDDSTDNTDDSTDDTEEN